MNAKDEIPNEMQVGLTDKSSNHFHIFGGCTDSSNSARAHVFQFRSLPQPNAKLTLKLTTSGKQFSHLREEGCSVSLPPTRHVGAVCHVIKCAL